MSKHFLKAFILYNWPAILWTVLCAAKVWEHTQVPAFDNKEMTVMFALEQLRGLLYGVRWGYAGLLGVIYLFFTYSKVAAKAVGSILKEANANQNRTTKLL